MFCSLLCFAIAPLFSGLLDLWCCVVFFGLYGVFVCWCLFTLDLCFFNLRVLSFCCVPFVCGLFSVVFPGFVVSGFVLSMCASAVLPFLIW